MREEATRGGPGETGLLTLGVARLHRDRYLMGVNVRPAALTPSLVPSPASSPASSPAVSTEGAEVDLVNPANGAVYAEVEALGPGTTSPMRLNVGSGSYAFHCLFEDFGAITGATGLA